MTLDEKIAAAKLLADKKAEELSALLSTKVTPLVFIHEDEPVFGYVKEPVRIAKQRLMDATIQGRGIEVAASLVDSLLILEESDPRLISPASEFDTLNMGVTMAIYNMVSYAIDATKKNKLSS